MARLGRLRPRHCHNTVRSLYSSLKQTPWSQPNRRPSLTGSRWPILRSALLTTASNKAMSRSARLSALRARATRSTLVSASIHSWHMPGPNGPSRNTAGGTMFQPAPPDTAYPATSPPASAPWAGVTLRVAWQAAERAGRPALADDLQRALGESPGCSRRDPDPEHARTVLGNLLRERLDRCLRLFLGLDDHPLVLPVPGQRDRPDPEVLHQRQVERPVIGNLAWRGGWRPRGDLTGTAHHL